MESKDYFEKVMQDYLALSVSSPAPSSPTAMAVALKGRSMRGIFLGGAKGRIK
ncbi:hypothetical protein [Parabacteroides sp. ZJ-118]|uniref:hypothetical protein n=1 Tax=Parabacteroides sp. ZJ-118 TaxID=2709398 RepID=UPI0013ED530A|nr:hypothetical protein [Parabacteroides sp. ZJ-118]